MTKTSATSLTRARFASVVFDVDSTLVTLEGIDWLAERRGPHVAEQCASLTMRSMAGEIPIEAVYEQRLLAIVPTQVELEALSNAYIAAVQPGARALITALRTAGVMVYMVSGGIRDAMVPLAAYLGVPEPHLHAVQLATNASDQFVHLRGVQPLATQRGKPDVISTLRMPRPSVMIGDGATDAAARTATDCFIAYTGVVERAAVVASADHVAKSFAELTVLLFEETPC